MFFVVHQGTVIGVFNSVYKAQDAVVAYSKSRLQLDIEKVSYETDPTERFDVFASNNPNTQEFLFRKVDLNKVIYI